MSIRKDQLDACEAGDYEAEWAEEAEKRYLEYQQGLLKGQPGKQVFRDAKARFELLDGTS